MPIRGRLALLRKADPDIIKRSFQEQLDELEQFFTRVTSQILGTPNEKADSSQLAQNVFLSACVAHEVMVSDLFLAYINRDPSVLQRDYEKRVRQSVRSSYGDWETRVQFTKQQHIPISELPNLIDPDSRNLTFKDVKKMKEKSSQLLSQQYSRRIRNLSKADEQLLDAAKAIRDYIAHRSGASRARMNQLLLEVESSPDNNGLGRKQNEVHSAGSFLKTKVNGKSRVVLYFKRLEDIANKI